MKRILTLTFLCLYLLSLVGLNVNVHHCAGKSSYQFFGINLNNDCDCEHESIKHTSSCCHNEQVVIKGNDTNQIVSNLNLVKNNWSLILAHFVSFDIKINCSSTFFKRVVKPEYPPRYSSPIYILNRVFLI
jgi:hypothetical protein